MKNLFVLAVAGLVATSANAAEMKWSGSAGWRYEQTKTNDSLETKVGGKDTSTNTTKSQQLRANIGATGGWENVEWGAGLRTMNAANDDHVTLQNNGDRNIGLEQAWFRYLRDFGSLDLAVTFGRQKNVLAYDNVSQNLFDNDVRWDGLGWQFKFGMFGINAAQYVLGSKTNVTTSGASTITNNAAIEGTSAQQRFNYLLAVQPHATWKFSDEIEAMFALGFYTWKDNSGTNAIPVNGAATAFRLENSQQWHVLTAWTLPYNLGFNFEWVNNKKQKYDTRSVGLVTPNPEASRTAWSAGLTYGSLKKANDFTVGYAYGTKGIASVDNRYTYEKFAADNKGHTINVGYALADNFHLGWKGLFLKEKEKIDPATGAAYAGANSKREGKTNYWELTAGVMF